MTPKVQCDDPFYCACCHSVGFVDNVNCWFIYQGDIFITGTYIISGNIITIMLDDIGITPPYHPTYRIIDNNTIVEIGTDDVLIKL